MTNLFNIIVYSAVVIWMILFVGKKILIFIIKKIKGVEY